MKVREINLIKLLKICTDKVDCETIAKPQISDYKTSSFYNELNFIYKKLDGTQNEIPFNIGNYDCVVNGTIIELDEENHFNRYRAITLQAEIYDNDITFTKEKYVTYCKIYEGKCGKGVGFWSNDSSDKWFGQSNTPGNLEHPGSSRWKQRAFYDLLKDHIPYLLNIPIKRISIYEELLFEGKKFTVDEILKSGERKYSEIIYKRLLN